MICTDCNNPKFECKSWITMKEHYKVSHPEVKRPDKYFTYEARHK